MKDASMRTCMMLLFLSCCFLAGAQGEFRVYPYLQNPAPDAITILWFSNGDFPGQLSWWKENSGEPILQESDPEEAGDLAYPVWEDTTFFGGMAPPAPFRHRIRLEGLEPGTLYEYLVTQGSASFSSSFRTAPSGNEPVRFIVYSDPETEPESTGNHTAWVDPVNGEPRSYLVDQTDGYRNNLAVIRSREPDLVLVAGDLTQHGGEQRDWDEFWKHNTGPEKGLSLAGQVPIMPAPGNHDYYEGTTMGQYNQPGSERAISRYLSYFEVPENHSPNIGQEGRYYSFSYGPVSFIALDLCNNSPNGSEEDTNYYLLGENDPEGGDAPDFGVGSRQYMWLESELSSARERSIFTFVYFHHAPYSSGPHGFPPGEGELLDNQSGIPVRTLTPLFMEYGVDAVFSGHDEIWERSEVTGTERLPGGQEVTHLIHFYDVGTGGDGLRGPLEGTDNPFQAFLAHENAPEVWVEGVLIEGGKHYGHLEVEVEPLNDSTWQATLSPVYVLPVYDPADSTYPGYERMLYDDTVILTRGWTNPAVSSGSLSGPGISAWNFPNPFVGETIIEYYLPAPAGVTITIVDQLGRTVRVINEQLMGPGKHQTRWDGKGKGGTRVEPGFYLYLLETGSGPAIYGNMLLLQ